MRGNIPQYISVGIKCLIAVWTLSGASLSFVIFGPAMDVPVLKYLYEMLKTLDGLSIESIFMLLGIGTVFYLVKDRQKNPWLSVLSAFFAVCTVCGISYENTNSWNGIVVLDLRLILVVFILLGYYFLYKNGILLIAYIMEQKTGLFRREARNKVESFLFEKHTFLGPLLVILVFGLPWLISFFPGTLEWDAHTQLWMYLGGEEKTGHFPVAMTEFMGGCIQLGRYLFQSDTIGLFFYTIFQFALQTLTFSYALHVMQRMRVPVIFRWLAMFVWAVFPFFPIWGYTMVKDTMHYIFILLLVSVLQEILFEQKERIKWWQLLLFLTSIIGIGLTRNDGRYTVLITMLAAVFLYRKYWKLFLLGICTCFLVVFAEEGIYMPSHGFAAGPVKEMLSIPLQQTARYLRDYSDELTEEETEILQRGFSVELSDIGALYNPNISDPVKEKFVKYPEKGYLKQYFRVWFQQFLRHPDAYVQAFLNHVYGYFYPNKKGFEGYLAIFSLCDTEHCKDSYLDIKFAVTNHNMRKLLEYSLRLLENIPVLSMFLSVGFHTYLLLGETVYLLSRKKKEVLILVPTLMVLLICLVSPVNACIRYMLPIMVTLPMNAAWCYSVTHVD